MLLGLQVSWAVFLVWMGFGLIFATIVSRWASDQLGASWSLADLGWLLFG